MRRYVPAVLWLAFIWGVYLAALFGLRRLLPGWHWALQMACSAVIVAAVMVPVGAIVKRHYPKLWQRINRTR